MPSAQREEQGKRGAATSCQQYKGAWGRGGSCITHAGLRWETGGEGEGGCSMMPPVSKGGAGALSVVFPPATSQGQCMRLAYRYARFVRKFV